ncbi:MAG: hypothetical protein HYR64_04060 [Fimbriimonas ginsengisoli]|uniref:Uncharacterized protein n=1 Tax=Fimbriimonas ginsengisoli TaxID=1005039 RepID=A0A931LWR1_FIMGI|nr:hypothetical protein [Fimbriimonas ginsengisoli]
MLFALMLTQGVGNPFFPLVEGTRLVYDDTVRPGAWVTNEVGKSETVRGKPASPIRSTSQGQDLGAVFYRTEGDSVLIVGHGAATPYPQPWPLFRLPEGKREATWSYEGDMPVFGEPMAMQLSGKAVLGGRRKVLDRDVDVLLVEIDITASSGEVVVKNHQSCMYAREIGLVEMKEVARVAGQPREHTIKLVRIETPGGRSG